MNSERLLVFISEIRSLARPPVVPEAELLDGLIRRTQLSMPCSPIYYTYGLWFDCQSVDMRQRIYCRLSPLQLHSLFRPSHRVSTGRHHSPSH